MENIIEPTIDHDFSNLYLGPPSSIQGGAYFTRIMHGNNKQFYVQTPKSLSKQGFVKSGKKIYIDLMFESNDTVFVNWIENLEIRCQELLYTKSEQWFQNALEKSDIESAFTSTLKIFKSGKYYLLRVNVKPNIKIYSENDEIVEMDNVNPEKHMISILEIQGIKFTSRNFQMEIELKQSMVVSPDPFLDECFIKKPVRKQLDVMQPQQQNANVVQSQPIEPTPPKVDDVKLDLTTSELLSDFIKESANDLNEVEVEDDKQDESSHQDSPKEVEHEDEMSKEVSKEDTEENIQLDFEDISPDVEVLEKEELKEFDPAVNLEKDSESITLKKPNQVYHEIYQKAREKAKSAKKMAIQAYLELKNIKKTYMLDDMEDDSDESDDIENDDFCEEDSDNNSEDEEEYEY
jgi:hypothetical protein